MKKQLLLLLAIIIPLTANVPDEVISARRYGMGGSFAAIEGDPAAALYNPASLGSIDKQVFFSTKTTLVGEVDYYAFSWAGAYNNNVWGLSYITRMIGDIPVSDEINLNNNNIDFSNFTKSTFENGVIALSYARLLSDKWSLGMNGKMFFSRASGIDDANARGMNLDVGVIYRYNKKWSLGFTDLNVINSKYIWDTGETENIPSKWVFGIKTTALKRNIKVLLDFKSSYVTNYPVLIALGTEWHPDKNMFYRFGIDQNVIMPDYGSENLRLYYNYFMGLGLNIGGFRFDYAYKYNTDFQDLSNHIFSFSYVGDEPVDDEMVKIVAKVKEDKQLKLEKSMDILIPLDKVITTSATVKVKVKLTNSDKVLINDEEYLAVKKTPVGVTIPIHLGLNDIIFDLSGVSGNQEVRKILRVASFADIADSPYKLQIEQLATLGFIKEDYPDKFNPKRTVMRKEVASIVTQVENIGIPLALKGVWQAIDLLFNQGIIKGFPGGEILPNRKISRGELAAIIARLMDLELDRNKSTGYSLAKKHWAYPAVTALAETGVYQQEDFLPYKALVTKEELADRIARLPKVQDKITSLLNFEDVEIKEQELPSMIIKNQMTISDEYNLYRGLVESAEIDDTPVREAQIPNSSYIKPKPAVVRKTTAISIYQPVDKKVVYSHQLVVRGSVNNIKTVLVNGKKAVIVQGAFSKKISLKKGKNLIKIKLFGDQGVKIIKRRVLYLPSFRDIGSSVPAKETISGMAALGYIKGDRNNNFQPNKKMTRASYAKLLCDAYRFPLPKITKAPFADVPANHWAAREIKALALRNYMSAEGNRFKPNGLLTNAFGAVVLARMENLKLPANNPQSYLPYTDLPPKYWASKSIYACLNAGVLKSTQKFYPMNSLNRLSAAVWLSRTKHISKRLKDLFNWNKGY